MFPRPLPFERGCPLAFPLPLPFQCVWLSEDPLDERPEDALEERDEADCRDIERWGDLDRPRECPADLFDADLARPRPFWVRCCLASPCSSGLSGVFLCELDLKVFVQVRKL